MPILTDRTGCTIRLSRAESLADWDATVMAFLAHSAATPTHLGALLGAEPDCAIAHALKGLFHFLLGRRETVQTAEAALSDARLAAATRDHDPREAAFVDALTAALSGSPRGAVDAMERVLRASPQDALAMKVGHAIRFTLGDARGMRASLERITPAWDPAHPALGYLHGCHAFALEETGDYARAETAGRLGLRLAPDDAWGLHAVAHVHDMTGQSRAGLDWLSGREQAWAHCNNFRYHVWWHKALMHLDQGEVETVLDLYDTEIRRDRTDDYRDISNATSLLQRLELDGIDIGDRWEELAEFSADRTEDGCLIFADLHYLMALSADGRDDAIASMMARMRRDAADLRSERAATAAHPGLAAAAGLEAFGEGDYGTAYLNLAAARAAMPTIGGSHAQRDVFARLTIDAAVRSGHLDAATALLDDRTAQRAGRDDRYADVRRDLISRAEAATTPLLDIAE